MLELEGELILLTNHLVIFLFIDRKLVSNMTKSIVEKSSTVT